MMKKDNEGKKSTVLGKVNAKKVGVAASSIAVVAAGTVLAVSAYQSDQSFDPEGAGDIQSNQVVFSDENNPSGNDRKDKKDQSHSVDNTEMDDAKTQLDAGSDYLFDNGQLAQNVAVVNPANPGADIIQNNPGQNPGTIYDISGSGDSADTVISGDTGKGDNTSSGGNGGSGNGGTGDNGNGGNGSGTETKPTHTIKDPVIDKDKPSGSLEYVTDKPYSDTNKPAGDKDYFVYIAPLYDWGSPKLYKGQAFTDYEIYCHLDTYVYEMQDWTSGTRYYWTKEHYGDNGYIKVDSVSFDDGETWTSDFPVQIPADMAGSYMKIKVSYRLSLSDEWQEEIVDYEVSDNCIYVMKNALPEGSDTLSNDDILERGDPDWMTGKIHLLYSQEKMLGEGKMDKLFPGWMEDGEMVPWFYTPTVGRHILEPADCVPLSDDYTVYMKLYYMTPDYEMDYNYGSLSYLQTLTGFKQSAVGRKEDGSFWDRIRYDEIQVPKYIQAIEIDEEQELEVDYLKVPDTVMYINNTGKGLIVNYGYEVDKDNPYYQSTDEGVLMNKAGTKIEGIPHDAERLTVPATVEKVTLDEDNKIGRITLDAETEDQVPEMNFKNVGECDIEVSDDLLETVALRYYKEFAPDSGHRLVSKDNPDISYTVKNGFLINNKGEVRKVLPIGSTTVRIPDSVKKIQADAFADAGDVTTVFMPEDGDTVVLDKNCLSNSNVEKIICYSKKQFDSVKEQIKSAGAQHDVEVALLDVEKSKEGYTYAKYQDTEGTTTYMLLTAPKDVEEFDGKITDTDGNEISISEISDRAFANCEKLIWVTLPESVKRIGQEAFEGCTALQGVLAQSSDTIAIGNDAFEGCKDLRFVGSNAMKADMEQGYDPLIKDTYRNDVNNLSYFFIPSEAEGYGTHVMTADVSGFQMYDAGVGKMLYGADDEGNLTIGLRCGTTVGATLSLPATTTTLARFAMAGTEAEDGGAYTVNWSALTALRLLAGGCFEDSRVSGEVLLTDCEIGEEAFDNCKDIETLILAGDKADINYLAFTGCKKLKKVTFEAVPTDVSLGLFSECDNLTDITFGEKNTVPPKLLLNDEGYGFQFNTAWSKEEETEHLSIHVPKGSEDTYLQTWKYLMLGYFDSYNEWTGEYRTAYQNLWDATSSEMINADLNTTDQEIDVAVEAQVLEAENRIREMLGLSTVSEPTNYFPYRIYNEYLTLVGAMSYITDVRLDYTTLGFPEGWYLDYVGTGAFSRCKNLNSVTMESNLVGIQTNAFKGVTSNFTLNFEGPFPPKLVVDEEGTPFEFGVSDDQIHISVPEGYEQSYIDEWKYPLCGYTDAWDMLNAVPDDDEREAMLLKAENRLRKMMGLELIQIDETDPATEDNESTPAEPGKMEESGEQSEDAGETEESEEEPKSKEDKKNNTQEKGSDDTTDGTGKDTEE